MEEEQYFKFREQAKAALFIDGNYMLNISRVLNIKLDMEQLFDEITKGLYRFRTYWYSALESSLDRNNNAYRFLDRLKYIPRTRVYAGRMTKRSQGHYESALRTDAGIALAIKMVEVAEETDLDYIILIAGDPEYVPAIRSAQRKGILVRLVYPEYMGDLDPHPDLQKAVDERNGMDSAYLQDFEYINEYEYDDDEEDEDESTFDEALDDETYDENQDDLEESYDEELDDEFIEDDLEIVESDEIDFE